MEIERKFLVNDLENLKSSLSQYKKQRYIQGYISVNPTIRLRNEGGVYALCVKSTVHSDGLSRDEFELDLTQEQFDRLWKKVETKAVVKDRYCIPIESGLVAELDIYYGELEGLATIEVEFETVGAAKKFLPPAWFGKDISGDYRYKNSSLAIFGLPNP